MNMALKAFNMNGLFNRLVGHLPIEERLEYEVHFSGVSEKLFGPGLLAFLDWAMLAMGSLPVWIKVQKGQENEKTCYAGNDGGVQFLKFYKEYSKLLEVDGVFVQPWVEAFKGGYLEVMTAAEEKSEDDGEEDELTLLRAQQAARRPAAGAGASVAGAAGAAAGAARCPAAGAGAAGAGAAAAVVAGADNAAAASTTTAAAGRGGARGAAGRGAAARGGGRGTAPTRAVAALAARNAVNQRSVQDPGSDDTGSLSNTSKSANPSEDSEES